MSLVPLVLVSREPTILIGERYSNRAVTEAAAGTVIDIEIYVRADPDTPASFIPEIISTDEYCVIRGFEGWIEL